MNARVLELIKNPENIQSEDLKLLESEIKTKPYIQNIRALYLYGTHQFNPENYQKELSKTAAYTTDKKILYHFINKNSMLEVVENEEVVENKTLENLSEEIPVAEVSTEPVLEIEDKTEPKTVFVNGKRNRILFEGEENFLESSLDKTQDETVAEAENISTKPEIQQIVEEQITEETSEIVEPKTIEEIITDNKISEPEIISEDSEPQFSEEKIIEEPQISTDIKDEVSAELSFHGIDTFLPNVAVPVENKVENYQPKQETNRHEEEMKRLIAEVEAKIKAKKDAQPVQEKVVEEDIPSGEISFAETQSFDLKTVEPKYVDEVNEAQTIKEIPQEKTEEISKEFEIKEVEPVKENTPIQNTSWKPMSISSNTPDALIQKKETPKAEVKPEPEQETRTLEVSTEKEERQVLNVSFFAPNVSKIESEEKTEPKLETVKEEAKPADSNVPQFINTWQNWLKIDRKDESSKEEIKEKAIEKFIENEPKISKLKEETNFVVKEKADDISHLMTETLAKLYVEQRLYSKAIKAYETLQKKHPEKSEYFAEKINEVKDLRTNK